MCAALCGVEFTVSSSRSMLVRTHTHKHIHALVCRASPRMEYVCQTEHCACGVRAQLPCSQSDVPASPTPSGKPTATYWPIPKRVLLYILTGIVCLALIGRLSYQLGYCDWLTCGLFLEPFIYHRPALVCGSREERC